MTRVSTVVLAALACLFVEGTANAVELSTFDLASDPNFARAGEMARWYALAHSRLSLTRLCVVGLSRGADRSAWIVWRDSNQLILWEGQDLRTTPSRRALDLRRDVVASEADLHGSTYLVTRNWADTLIQTCRRRGLQVEVRRRR